MNSKHKLIGSLSLDRDRGKSSVVISFFELLASSLGHRVPLDVEGILGMSVNPDYCRTAAEFRDSYLLSEVLSKYPFKDPSIDRTAVALAKFKEAEAWCSLANETVRVNTIGPEGLDWLTVISTAKSKILHLLGSFSWNRAEEHFAFGPGASTSLKREFADAIYKIGNKPDVTQDCALLAWCAVYRIPRWFELLTGSLPSGNSADDLQRFPPEAIFNIVAGNRVVTVPKNAKTDRVIAIEPDMNMYVQKGIGKMIRKRLLQVGVDLDDQTVNQDLAREGSISDCLATIDFSAASDTISREIVELLLPEDWLVALKQCRSPVGVLPSGEILQYHKFSSMGNGYTFELESLIFWALARAVADLCRSTLPVVRDVVMVYGDDLIVSSELQEPMRWAFTRAGFTLNLKKSFFRGPFRESCGKHFFRGVDVSPFYVKKELNSIWAVYALANRLRAWSRLSFGLDPRLKPVHRLVVNWLPRTFRRLIPDGIGDVGLVADFDEARPNLCNKSRQRGILVYVCEGYLPLVKRTNHEGYRVLVKWFLLRKESAPPPPSKGKAPSVGELQRVTADVAVRQLFKVQQWPSYGPWL